MWRNITRLQHTFPKVSVFQMSVAIKDTTGA
jgi:hypothetical protein